MAHQRANAVRHGAAGWLARRLLGHETLSSQVCSMAWKRGPGCGRYARLSFGSEKSWEDVYHKGMVQGNDTREWYTVFTRDKIGIL